jgi:hypothetical protein
MFSMFSACVYAVNLSFGGNSDFIHYYTGIIGHPSGLKSRTFLHPDTHTATQFQI